MNHRIEVSVNTGKEYCVECLQYKDSITQYDLKCKPASGQVPVKLDERLVKRYTLEPRFNAVVKMLKGSIQAGNIPLQDMKDAVEIITYDLAQESIKMKKLFGPK